MGTARKKALHRDEYKKQRQEAQIAGKEVELPRKKFYRQRAHANPFSDYALKYPLSPAHMDWASHYPGFVNPDASQTTLTGTRKLLKDVEVADIGCGFGGLLIGLAPVLPDTLMVGMEIRAQVTEFLIARIAALRAQQVQLRSGGQVSASSTKATNPSEAKETQAQEIDIPEDAPALPGAAEENTAIVSGGYQNITAIRANTMKFLPRFFGHHQLSKIFICFPDPHFKARKHKARIVSSSLNAEYAFVLRPGGLLYTITDVEEYHRWILEHFGVPIPEVETTAPAEPSEQSEKKDEEQDGADSDSDDESGQARVKELFERVSDEELAKDECARVMREETEEGRKVARNNGPKFVAVFRRLPDPEWPTS